MRRFRTEVRFLIQNPKNRGKANLVEEAGKLKLIRRGRKKIWDYDSFTGMLHSHFDEIQSVSCKIRREFTD